MGNKKKTLQILIPQYEETEEVIKPLLDSIALQQSVDFNEIGVIICNDGTDVHLSKDFLNSYPYEIEYHLEPHRGVSGTRNACFEYSTADYVMFCDADDMFYNMCGLWILFREIYDNGGFDSLVSVFVEETMMPAKFNADGTPDEKAGKQKVFINREMDSTFVHGKVHKRQYLLDKNIKWNEKLTIHEDSYFNILCQNLSENVKYCQTPFYLWKWRDESVCRHDDKYMLKTYNNMLDSNEALVAEFIRRGMKDKASFFCVFMIFDAYYTMNKPEWINQENKQYRDAVERRFAKYFNDHKKIWNSVSPMEKVQISNGVRSRSVSEGMQMESVTIESWLRQIKKRYKQ